MFRRVKEGPRKETDIEQSDGRVIGLDSQAQYIFSEKGLRER